MRRQDLFWLAANYFGWLALGGFAFFLIAWIIPLSTSILAPLPLVTLIPARQWLTHRTYLRLNPLQSILVLLSSSVLLSVLVGGMFRLTCHYSLIPPYARFFWTADGQCGGDVLNTTMALAGVGYLVIGGLFMWASSRSGVWEFPRMSPKDIERRFARYESVASIAGGVTFLLVPAIPITMWQIVPGFLVGNVLSVLAGLMVWRTPGERWKVLIVGGLVGELVCLFIFPSAWIGALMLWGRTGVLLDFSVPEPPIDMIGFQSLILAAWYVLVMLLAGLIHFCGWMSYRGAHEPRGRRSWE